MEGGGGLGGDVGVYAMEVGLRDMEISLDLQDRSKVEGAIAGAIRDSINTHGPITPQMIGSAAKRVYSTLKQLARDQKGVPPLAPEDWSKKWDHWHNGIPGEGAPLSELPLFKEE